MRRFGTTAAMAAIAGVLVSFGASHACLRYHWTISESESQYDVPWGSPSGSPASVSLYLWIACTAPLETTGLIAAEVGLAGSLTVLDFLPRNGFTNLGTPSNLLLQPPSCVTAPPAVLVGEIVVHDPGPGGTLCLVPSGNQLMLGVDCPTPPTAWPIGGWGFSSDGTPLCTVLEYVGHEGTDPCGCDFIAPQIPTAAPEPLTVLSWGQVKATYR